MKIGIITLIDEKNYGNRWQNYAMNELLHSINIETENLYFWIRNNNRKCLREMIKRMCPIKLAYFLHTVSAYQIKNSAIMRRVIKFTHFTQKYMGSYLILANTYDELCNRFHSEGYDYFAAGSDQVWNPYYAASPIYFLQFVNKQKRLSFMASFGSDKIPREQVPVYEKWMKEMSYISVREPSGADIVKSLTGKSADIFFDPTLLLEKEKWILLSYKPKGITLPERYAVIYMFDCNPEVLREVCSGWNINLLILNDKNNKKLYSLDPAEMLYLLNHAEIVFTDSFHIMALSIRLNKQFYIFKRTGFEYMFDRLESTLVRLGITQCIYPQSGDIIMCPIRDKDYEEINYQLDMERIRFLETVCNITK